MTDLEQAIAEILDYPSVFMGGPSRQSLRKADAIVAMLTERIATGQLVPAQVWQSMESAPKDGRDVLMFSPDMGYAVWSSCAGWHHVTHWMPLPPPPAEGV